MHCIACRAVAVSCQLRCCTCRYTCCIWAQVACWCNKCACRILGQSIGHGRWSTSFVQNEHIFPKGWPHSAVCLGTRAECRTGERLAEWHVLRGCHKGGTAQEPDKHGGRVGPSDFLVGRMELCPSDEFSDRDFDLRDSGIRHCS